MSNAAPPGTEIDIDIEIVSKPFDLHILVCTNTRVAPLDGLAPDGKPAPLPKQSCGPLGAENIRAELKTWVTEQVKNRPILLGRVRTRVNGSGCLDFCKKGIVIAVYPQSEFLFFVKNSPDSLAAVKANILQKLNELENQIGK